SFFFFFQAEDGIRDPLVTGVQTCALPILRRGLAYSLIRVIAASTPSVVVGLVTNEKAPRASACWRSSSSVIICTGMWRVSGFCRSEERRVGKGGESGGVEWRSRCESKRVQ